MTTLSIVLPLIFLSLGMAAAWAVQRRTGNSGWVDTAWSALTGLAAILGLWLSGSLVTPHGIVGAVILLVWSGRLVLHIGGRSRLSGEDPRYAALLEEWGNQASGQLFKFLQIQALVSTLLVLSVVAAASAPRDSTLFGFDIAALMVALVAIAGETIADRQLTEYRTQNHAFKGICDIGLWRWSRHPNYFFEWLFWCSWPIMALSASPLYVALSLLAPALMYWLLVHVSGIPPLEKHMLSSRGERFRLYQTRTNAFFPGPPRPYDTKETAK